MAAPIEVVLPDEAQVIAKACRFIISRANNCIKTKGSFVLGVSGGSCSKYLTAGLPSLETDWTKWHVFFCDERYVPFDSPDSTYAVYKEGLLSKVGIPAENVHPIKPDVPIDECAADYERQVRSVLPGSDTPRFDILVLGMGPDGHTCSLFPGHPLLQEKEKVVAPITDSPKPPPSRVTLTMPVVNAAACCIFMACGASKADMVYRIVEGREADPLPAACVRPVDGELYWYLDAAAAAKLPKPEVSPAL